MKSGKKTSRSIYEGLKQKTFHSAMLQFLRKELINFGDLSLKALADSLHNLFLEYHPANENQKIGQVMWTAVKETETASHGKSMSKTNIKPVFVDLVTPDDLEKLEGGIKRRNIRKDIAIRLFNQTKQQQAVFTNMDVATLMNMSSATISKYVKEYENEKNILVPRRGTIHDMGPSITHKKEICYKIIVEGKSIEQVARETNHSPEAITRYVKDYKRIQTCLAKGLSIDETAMAVKLGKRLIEEYMVLIKENNLQKSKN